MRRFKLQSVLLIVGLSFSLSVFISFVFPDKVFGRFRTNIPDDATLVAQRKVEVSSGFVVTPPNQPLRPAERLRRDIYGDVGLAPLKTAAQLDRLLFPSVPQSARQKVVEGAWFFTTPETVREGAGSMANQTRCAGCHLNNLESVPGLGLLTGISNVSRAGRSTPTNFSYTSGDTKNGGRPAGVRLDPVNPDGYVNSNIINNADPALDAIDNTGRTAAFTIFGDFSPSVEAVDPTKSYDPLDGSKNPITGNAQNFGGFVQHVRPPIAELKAFDRSIDCKPDAIPSIAQDRNLGTINPTTGLSSSGYRRGVGERAGPPYIGRGLMEAIPNQDITNAPDPSDTIGGKSSLKTASFQCNGDCVTGKVNMIPANAPPDQPNALISGVGRFGLRANGAEILQFIIGGLQGELGITSLANNNEIKIADPKIAPYNKNCKNLVTDPEFHLSTPFSERNFLRLTAPPEFGPNLLAVLNSKNPSQPRSGYSRAASVQRGAQLFGIDLTAFANRMIPGRMPGGGDGRDPNAINQSDRMVSCVSCHTPVQRTGRSPAAGDPSLGTDAASVVDILSYRWAPIFSDLILHKGPIIDAERFAPTPRDPILVSRTTVVSSNRLNFKTYDLPRNLTDDIFSNQKATAKGEEFRTPPLMGIGKVGPPFLHDGSVYLSTLTRDTTPAGTVFTNSKVTNAPLVVRSVDDALRAAIELHDLPAPDDYKTSKLSGGGCPVPAGGKVFNKIGNVINYGSSPEDVICPPYTSAISKTHRSEGREVIARYRSLRPSDQQAIIDFLKEL
ncbi:di-heme oxidoredictase family protein [uncultured Nostoc sp.]|uniref:di-heme oxidoredictase family protein n=1 Tax=uncultured Nostoc sp. TaxID=340711 RepID=UPI0035CC4679